MTNVSCGNWRLTPTLLFVVLRTTGVPYLVTYSLVVLIFGYVGIVRIK